MGRVCSWVLQLCKRNVFDDVRKRVVWAIDPGAGVKCQKFHLPYKSEKGNLVMTPRTTSEMLTGR